MSGKILTPSAIWENFRITSKPTVEMIGEYNDGKFVYSRFYLIYEESENEPIKIYCSLARNKRKKTMPALFVVQDFIDGADESVLSHFVKKGYAVFTFDFAGKSEGNANRSVYPESLDYANYINCMDNLDTVNKQVTDTCWKVWGRIARYAYHYLRSLEYITDIGALGIGEASTVLWHFVGTSSEFACSVFVGNAGWTGYRGIYKFSDQPETQWTDEQMVYIAGVDPQSYARHITCPTLLLVATNSRKFDCDRANDTLLRMNNKVYNAIDYAVGMRDSVGSEALLNMEIFFNKYLDKKSNIKLPNDIAVKSEIKDGKLVVSVSPDMNDVEEVILYTAEQTLIPALRCWTECNEYERKGDDYVFTSIPYNQSEVIMFFARAIYKNGFSVGSSVFCKKFSQDEFPAGHKSNVIYSSRQFGAESVFTPARENESHPKGLCLKRELCINVNKGPNDIEGVNCYRGIITFNINERKFTPKDDAMLMLDVYTKEESVVTVKLISNYLGDKIEYVANTNTHGGEVWHNIRLELNQFKTLEGRPLRDYSKIEAIEIDAQGYYLINNFLWV